jgi:hypothetical protein
MLGGGQRLAVHELIGGGRVVDALGSEAGKLSFSGVFSGVDAGLRAQILDAATVAGEQLPLIWDRFFYLVVIESFRTEYEKPWWIPFSISCEIVLDPAAVAATALVSAGNLIAGDIASAAALSPLTGVSLDLAAGSGIDAIATAQGVVSGAVAATGVALDAGSAAFSGAADAAAGGAALTRIVGNAGRLAGLTAMTGYVNRAATNLLNQLT